MVETDILFPLLQFVALVAPAIAIFIQILDSSELHDRPAMRLLELSLILIIVGGVIIFVRLFETIGDFITFVGTGLVFGALILFAVGIAWRAVPFTDTLYINISSIQDIRSATSIGVRIIFIVMIPYVFAAGTFWLFQDLINQWLNYGPIRITNQLTPSVIFGVLLILIAMRINFYQVDLGLFSGNNVSDILTETWTASIVIILAWAIFVAPLFIAIFLLVFLLNQYFSIEASHVIYSVPYAWAILFTLFLYYVDMWAENEDEDMITTD